MENLNPLGVEKGDTVFLNGLPFQVTEASAAGLPRAKSLTPGVRHKPIFLWPDKLALVTVSVQKKTA